MDVPMNAGPPKSPGMYIMHIEDGLDPKLVDVVPYRHAKEGNEVAVILGPPWDQFPVAALGKKTRWSEKIHLIY